MNRSLERISALAIGALAFFVMLSSNPFGLEARAAGTLAIATLMITWWITEAIPMPVVALLPLILFPLMGIAGMEEVAAPYANPIIFLFMGGFMIALAIEKWNLHRRGALTIIKITGTGGNKIVLGFILASGIMSMWISNTATTMMMYPIALSVISVMEMNGGEGNYNNLNACLLLAIAYASNLGGIATIIGTPPNVAYTAFLQKNYDYTFQFADWMKICLPLSLLLLFILYIVMTRLLYPNKINHVDSAREMIDNELHKLGKITGTEKRVLVIFITTAVLWILKEPINSIQEYFKLNDSIIALSGALLMFVVPSAGGDRKPILEWKDTSKMAWGILILFGGGITLADQLEKAGIIQNLGQWIAGYATGGILLLFVVTIVSIFISEVMSNVAQVIVFAPVITGMAESLNIDPIQFGMAMTLGASCAGMLPMGTPPNAIVFASGRLKLKHMMATGFIMNIFSAFAITLFCWYLLPVMIAALK